MAKHPVPKKKTSKARSRSRYGSFKTKVLKQLTNVVNLSKCPDCGAMRPTHTVCPDCGKYRGAQIIDKKKKIAKITKIKA